MKCPVPIACHDGQEARKEDQTRLPDILLPQVQTYFQ